MDTFGEQILNRYRSLEDLLVDAMANELFDHWRIEPDASGVEIHAVLVLRVLRSPHAGVTG